MTKPIKPGGDAVAKSISVGKSDIPPPETNTSRSPTIRYDEIHQLTGFSRTTLWRLEQKNENPFPSRIRLTSRKLVWDRAEVLRYIFSDSPRGMAGGR